MSNSSSTSSSSPILVGVAGATGVVGQRFLSLLSSHPLFKVVCVTASEKNTHLPYHKACQWRLNTPPPQYVESLTLLPTTVDSFLSTNCILVFSALDSSIAGQFEVDLAKSGIAVFSNAKNHRMDELVPILVPHANSEHIDIVPYQQKQLNYKNNGFIVTNANCSSTGLVVALRVRTETQEKTCARISICMICFFFPFLFFSLICICVSLFFLSLSLFYFSRFTRGTVLRNYS